MSGWARAVALLLLLGSPVSTIEAQRPTEVADDEFEEFDEPAAEAGANALGELALGLGDPFAPPPETEEPPSEPEGEPWKGPSVEFAYATYVFADGHGAGRAHSFQFGGFIPLRWLRLGGRAEFGSRQYTLGQDDLVARGALTIGYQELERLGPFSPYAAMVGTVGVLLGNRFHTPVSRVIRGLGLEIGANVNVVQNLFVGFGAVYLRMSADGFGYNLWVLRVTIGL